MDLTVETLKKLPPQQKAYILLGVLVLISGLYWYLLYNPKSVELAGLKSTLEKKQAELNESKSIAADLPRFKAEVERLDRELKKALLELPDKKEIPSLLTSISNLGTEAGLEFLRFKPLQEVPSGFYAKVPVEISVKGTFHEVAVFLGKLTTLPRIVNVGSLNMATSKGKDDREKTIISTSGIATTYRFLESQSGKIEPARGANDAKK